MENNVNTNGHIYTEDQLMARLKFFIGICLALTLTGIVFVVLYSLIFVTQPLNAISPIDQKFFELIVPIATFLTGTLSGIMLAGGDKEARQKAMDAANKGWDKPTPPTPSAPLPTTPSLGSLSQTPSFYKTEPTLGFPTVRPEPQATMAPQVITGFGGKPGPAQMPHPEI